MRREVPKLIDELPLSAEPLNGITIIRVSNLQGVDLAAVATYSERGELFNVAVDSLKSGIYPPRPAKPQTMDEVTQESIRQFGFPLTFAVDEFRKKPTPLYQGTDRPVPLTVVSLHYARNRWVEQHIFHEGSTE